MKDEFDRLFDERIKTIDTRLKLNKLIALNLQLFNAITTYARQNDIPLPYSPQIIWLIRRIEEEDPDINITNGMDYAIRRNLTDKKSDKDLTEPPRLLFP